MIVFLKSMLQGVIIFSILQCVSTNKYDRNRTFLCANILDASCVVLPHWALSCNFSSAENLASLRLQDRANMWHYYLANQPPPPGGMD